MIANYDKTCEGTQKISLWVVEALDVWINVARDDVGKIEWNHISFLLEHNFTYWILWEYRILLS